MNKYHLIAISLLFLVGFAQAQVPKKRLQQNINVPTYSHIFPSLSGDGNQMIYLTNYTNSEGFETKYTYRIGPETWADPESIPSINRPTMDHIGSFCLSYDGNFVVFSSRRTPTIGNYDIWISEKIGNRWSQPKNPGKPLNSPSNEGNPSLSPDGKSIYFMRCEGMDNTKKRSCGIYVSHRISANRWSEPEAFPDYINTGNETTPRIMADNRTLIFASGRPGGMGMMDLYTTSLEYGTWSKPKPLSFINTEQNDEFISVPARGDIIYFTGTYRDQSNIFKAIIPEENRAEKVLMLHGKVSYNDDEKPSEDVLVQAFDVNSGEVYTTTRLKQNDNSYTLFLPEGTAYDVSAFPQKGGHTYMSQIFDLTDMLISRKEDLQMDLLALHQNMSIPLSTIRYERYTSNLTTSFDIEIKRIIGFLKKNNGTRIEIGAFIDMVYTDSIPSNDLTEVISDTVFFEIERIELTSNEDSSLFENADSILTETNEFVFEEDTTGFEQKAFSFNDTTNSFDIIEESFVSPLDSILAKGYELFEEREETEIYFKVNYTYHNDRTQAQAEALKTKLIASGVPAHLLEAKGYGDNWAEDLASEERNYWIELKILGN
jgi:hypothetical protein